MESKVPEGYYYTDTHEWLKLETKSEGLVGITDFAQKELGDITFVDLPFTGSEFKKGEVFGSIESVKVAEDLYAPVDIKVIEVNQRLSSNPELINQDPYGEGWMIKVQILSEEQVKSLLSAQQYKELI